MHGAGRKSCHKLRRREPTTSNSVSVSTLCVILRGKFRDLGKISELFPVPHLLSAHRFLLGAHPVLTPVDEEHPLGGAVNLLGVQNVF